MPTRAAFQVVSAISRLPPEILTEIFTRCVPMSIETMQFMPTAKLTWLNILQVCSLWHSVALNSPSFWSTLIPSHPKSISTFIARAKMAPLVIRADLDKTDGKALKTILLDNIQRLGTLELHSRQTPPLIDFLYDVDLIDADAPRLQYLKIVNTIVRDEYAALWIPWGLFHDLGDRTMAKRPAEFSLHLERCAFHWGSAWYSRVTHLHLENLVPELRPTMEGLLTILVSSPALQTLSLIQCPPTTLNGFPVDLPHLSALTIRANSSAPTCVRLLRYLTMPPFAVVDISRNIETPEKSNSTASLISDFSPTSPTTYDTVCIAHQNGFTYHLLDSTRPWWSRRFRMQRENLDLCEATRALINTLDFSTVTILHLVGSAAASKGVVLGQHLRRVQTLHLHETAPATWLDFLFTQAMFVLGFTHWKYKENGLWFRAKDGSLIHAWPGLRCLSLHKLNLGRDVWGTPDSLPPTRSEMLRALLWARREGGARVTRLEIEDCQNVFSHDLQHFRLFSDVGHDGKGLVPTANDGCESLRSYSIDVLARMLDAYSPKG